jgi:lysozyme
MAIRRGNRRDRWRRAAVAATGAALVMLALAGYGWWRLQLWRPDFAGLRAAGIEAGADSGVIDWHGVRAIGGSFVYLDASASAFARDPSFLRSLDDARAAGLRVGAVHRYDPCQPGDVQATNFVTLVPRDPTMLPAAVELSTTADDCPVHVSDGAVESELMTFVNQIETHSGKPAILKLSAEFARRYPFAARFDRKLWLTRTLVEPGYAGRPWAMWTANTALSTDIAEHSVRWVVVRR